jgi:iron complex transport system ATP-binding protein
MAVIVRDLCYAYEEKNILQNVSFQAAAGKLTVILGRNGSGKSTLFRLLAGALEMQHGQILVRGNDLASISHQERARLIGYLPQFHQAIFPFTVDVVLTGRAAYVLSLPGSHDREKVQTALRTVGIEHLRHRPYTELSGGERQLVMIARVLAQEPKIILLDEPVSHLDLANQTRLMALLKNLTKAGITVLVVLHDPNTAFLYGDDVLFLKNGKMTIPAEKTPPWNPAFIADVYGVAVESVPFRDKALIIPISGEGDNLYATI